MGAGIGALAVTGKPRPLCLLTWQLLGIPPLVILLLCLSWLYLDLRAEDLGLGLDRPDNIVYGRVELDGGFLYL